MAHDRQSVDMTKVWDSGEVVSTCFGSPYFMSEKAQAMHSPLLSWKGTWSYHSNSTESCTKIQKDYINNM